MFAPSQHFATCFESLFRRIWMTKGFYVSVRLPSGQEKFFLDGLQNCHEFLDVPKGFNVDGQPRQEVSTKFGFFLNTSESKPVQVKSRVWMNCDWRSDCCARRKKWRKEETQKLSGQLYKQTHGHRRDKKYKFEYFRWRRTKSTRYSGGMAGRLRVEWWRKTATEVFSLLVSLFGALRLVSYDHALRQHGEAAITSAARLALCVGTR